MGMQRKGYMSSLALAEIGWAHVDRLKLRLVLLYRSLVHSGSVVSNCQGLLYALLSAVTKLVTSSCSK